jgi:uncharacterized membrane protein YbhN (UPF0104 family)
MGWASAHVLNLGRKGLFVLLIATLGLQLAAGVGLANAAGFGEVEHVLQRFAWPWLLAIAGAVAVSFAGYHEAYRGSFGAQWQLPGPHRRAVALAGFGGFLAHGATALDVAALRAGGADRRDTAVRASAFGGLEYGVMAVAGCGAAIAVLVTGMHRPPPSFTLPWAIIPLPGFLVAFWLARRYHERLAGSTGWRNGLGIFLASIELVRQLFVAPLRRHSAVLGMTVFWAGDACAAWCGMALFGFHMNLAQLVVGFATGMVLTRRATPLAGAGLLSVALPVTVWYSGAPLAVAVPGMFVYQLLTLWLPTAVSLATMDTLRALVEAAEPTTGHRGTVNRAK